MAAANSHTVNKAVGNLGKAPNCCGELVVIVPCACETSNCECSFGRIVVSKETTPGSAPTLSGGLTETPAEEVSAMPDAINTDRQSIAEEYLRRSAADLAEATRTRLHYVKLARGYGLTFQRIGDALGVSEAAVRQLLARNGGEG